MKKFMFLMPFAALAMASCSNSEDYVQTSPASENQELKIFPSVGGATRGTVETTASISEFKLVVSGLFSTDPEGTALSSSWEETVTKNAGVWGLSTPLWWGNASTSADFQAYANNGAATYSDGKLIGFTPEEEVGNQKDLMVAYNSGTKTSFSAGVPLHFQHALSQVVVKANYVYDETVADHPDIKVKVKGVRIVNVNPTGTLTLPTTSTVSGYSADWSLTGTPTQAYESTYESPVALLGSTSLVIDNSATAGPMLLIPQTQSATANLKASTVTGSYLMVKVDIDYAEPQDGKTNVFPAAAEGEDDSSVDDQFAWVAIPLNINWTAGYKYTYTLNFTNYAAGYAAPDQPGDDTPDDPGFEPGAPILKESLTPLTFTVTVEDTWQEVGSNLSPM